MNRLKVQNLLILTRGKFKIRIHCLILYFYETEFIPDYCRRGILFLQLR